MATNSSTAPPSQQRRQIAAACETALDFDVSRFESLQVTRKEIVTYATEEVGFSPILIDNAGLSGGMRAYLLQPIKEILSEWRRVKSDFDDLLLQKLPAIDSVNRLNQEVVEAESQRDAECEEIELRLESDENYLRLKARKENADLTWEDFKAVHGSRRPRMFAWSAIYKALLICIAIALAVVSYQDLYNFIQPSFVIIYLTFIQAILLVFAGHSLAKLLKQARVRLRRYKRRRFGAVITFILSLLALAVALAPALSLHFSMFVPPVYIFGSTYSFQPQAQSPDVLDLEFKKQILHLGIAFLVCFVLSIICHDSDPDYMAATKLRNRRLAQWTRRRRRPDREIARIKAKFSKLIDEKRGMADARSQSVDQEMVMMEKIRNHEGVIQLELRQLFARNLDVYRSVLFQLAQDRPGQISFIRETDGSEISPYDIVHGRVTAEMFQRLTSWLNLSAIRWPT